MPPARAHLPGECSIGAPTTNVGVAVLARDQRALNRFRKFCQERGVREAHSDDEHKEQRPDHAQPANPELERILADINDEPDEQAPAASKSGVLSGALRRGMSLFRRRG